MDLKDAGKSTTLNKGMLERFQQVGHVHVPIEFGGTPRSYVFALTLNFSMHSFFAAVEPLRISAPYFCNLSILIPSSRS